MLNEKRRSMSRRLEFFVFCRIEFSSIFKTEINRSRRELVLACLVKDSSAFCELDYFLMKIGISSSNWSVFWSMENEHYERSGNVTILITCKYRFYRIVILECNVQYFLLFQTLLFCLFFFFLVF